MATYLWLKAVRLVLATGTEETGPFDVRLSLLKARDANSPARQHCHPKAAQRYSNNVLGLWELFGPSPDVHAMLAVRRHEPLDFATELLESLGGGSGVRVGDVDENAVVDSNGSGATANGDYAKAALCDVRDGRDAAVVCESDAYKGLAKRNHAGKQFANDQVGVAGVGRTLWKRGVGSHCADKSRQWKCDRCEGARTRNKEHAMRNEGLIFGDMAQDAPRSQVRC